MSTFQPAKFLKVALASAIFASTAAFAAPVNFSGALTASDPVFNRPFTTVSLSGAGTAVHYDTYAFSVSANGAYSIEAISFNASGGLASDTFLSLYSNQFSASAPLTNLVQVDDDSGVGNLSLLNSNLLAGIQYFLVFSSYANGVTGAYTGVFNTVTGGGQVTLGNVSAPGVVPEPATLALLALAFAGLTVVRRRSGL